MHISNNISKKKKQMLFIHSSKVYIFAEDKNTDKMKFNRIDINRRFLLFHQHR